MSIKQYVDERDMLLTEMKRNNTRNRKMRERVNDIDKYITDFLKGKDQPGIKYKGRVIILETKEHRPQKKAKEKEQDMIDFLKSQGVSNAVDLYKKMIDIQRRSPVEKVKLKVSKITK